MCMHIYIYIFLFIFIFIFIVIYPRPDSGPCATASNPFFQARTARPTSWSRFPD